MDDHHLTQQHFYVFGHTISTFAKVEQGFKLIIHRMTGLDVHLTNILTEPYSASALANVIDSLHKHYDLPEDAKSQLSKLVDDFRSFGRLRNEIAHCMWVEGTRQDSIKPISLNIRSGTAKFKGVDSGERDWTLEELHTEAERFGALHIRQIELLDEFFASDIAE